MKKEKVKTILTALLGACFLFVMPFVGDLITSEPTETTEEVETTTTETEVKTHPKEQAYLVRYATPIYVDDKGMVTYEDTEGNLWYAQDAPNCDVRLLFNSNETFSITDDVIVDIKEIK